MSDTPPCTTGSGAPPDTRTKLLVGALETLVEKGIAKTSARSVAAAAGVNQALVFYHFGSVDDLLAEACRYGAEQRVALYRDRFARVTTLAELLDLGRELHARERTEGHVAVLAQLLAGAQTQPRLVRATAGGLESWITELEAVLGRVLAQTPLAELLDVPGLAKALAASFVGLELYEGVDAEGAAEAFGALEQLAALAAALDELGPVAQRAVRARLRRTTAYRGATSRP
ncbi:TetR/AcrR family transcriptional regulator [Streptomyces durbertensis]|uniref:TetR/AcrR family transcriptional regulator n=1 Tax=Streptomyces durbertensis TaxID=2448886 RepID=A0ABR6EKF4_9ACTN|nr:TetR/AcrR family transcriptional regulator [Streptomyces durbertensis]MBB1245430.1 TetR/AcrR family transcriptional regulator [Streptomyces durbertensis]